MRSAKDLRIIAIEGGDFTGKTTQAKLLAEKLDGLNIVIHFPRVNTNPKVKEVYNRTSSILYNMDFWMKEFKPLIDGFTYDYNFKKYESVKESDAYNKILNVICENVDVNYFDKLLFIKNLHNLIYKGVTIPYLTDIAECVYNNHKIIPLINYSDPNMTPDKTNTNNYLNECIGNTKVNIILDRFLISGYVYNKCIPIEFLYMIENKFISDNTEIDKHDKSLKTYLIEKLFNLFMDRIATYQIHDDCEIADNLNLLFESSNDHINWNSMNRINPCFHNICLINTNEELIKKLSGNAENDSSRKFDEYDKNEFIQKKSNELFNSTNIIIILGIRKSLTENLEYSASRVPAGYDTTYRGKGLGLLLLGPSWVCAVHWASVTWVKSLVVCIVHFT